MGLFIIWVAYSIYLISYTSSIGDQTPQLCPASVTQPPVFYSNHPFIGANVTPWYFWSTWTICFCYACATITPTSSLYLFKLLLNLNYRLYNRIFKFWWLKFLRWQRNWFYVLTGIINNCLDIITHQWLYGSGTPPAVSEILGRYFIVIIFLSSWPFLIFQVLLLFQLWQENFSSIPMLLEVFLWCFCICQTNPDFYFGLRILYLPKLLRKLLVCVGMWVIPSPALLRRTLWAYRTLYSGPDHFLDWFFIFYSRFLNLKFILKFSILIYKNI